MGNFGPLDGTMAPLAETLSTALRMSDSEPLDAGEAA